ncbi:hypothetical protein QE152_g6994 [Popillia japonica]|uniref:Uncharacterized protein n=1 Tax=Popillia japonica TaxID=7064 RepID=A0AAW1MEY3_POPJA
MREKSRISLQSSTVRTTYQELWHHFPRWVRESGEMVSLGQCVKEMIRVMWWSSWNSGNKQASGAAIMKSTPPLVFTTIVARVSCPEPSNDITSAVIWRLISQSAIINTSACISTAGPLYSLNNDICIP